jgi:hypothetical protein
VVVVQLRLGDQVLRLVALGLVLAVQVLKVVARMVRQVARALVLAALAVVLALVAMFVLVSVLGLSLVALLATGLAHH